MGCPEITTAAGNAERPDRTRFYLPPVVVPAVGGSNSTIVGHDYCLLLWADLGAYRCTFTVTATEVKD
jgi:hypothetical protein